MTKINNKDNKLSDFKKEQLETLKKIGEYKQASEANIVAILYKEPDRIYNTELQLKDFSHNIWRVYFQIASDLILLEEKNVLDDITIGLYLEKHPKLQAKYDEYGGYETILNAKKYVKVENLDGYIKELHKWNTVVVLATEGYPIHERLSDYCDMTLEDIYNEFEVFINHTFVNVDNEVKTYDISDGIDDLIENLDDGMAIGLPYYNMPALSKETGGQYLGSITLVGGLGNVGKSTFARTAVIPSIIENNERIVVMLNEDNLIKWQREFLVFVCNNVINFDLQKHVVRDGKYSPKVKSALKEAAEWIKEKTADRTITIAPFKRYTTSLAIRVIKKYAGMGVKYFMLDTFKMDAGKVSDMNWLQMAQSMVDIHDVIKPESKNLHIFITFQLSKGSIKQRYYTQDNIGMSRSIVDPASTCIMIRDVYEDEFPGGARELYVYRLEGKNGKTKIPVKLEKGNKYQILFIVKNREGSANQYQIVIEHDMSRNIMKEIGVTNVPIDF